LKWEAVNKREGKEVCEKGGGGIRGDKGAGELCVEKKENEGEIGGVARSASGMGQGADKATEEGSTKKRKEEGWGGAQEKAVSVQRKTIGGEGESKNLGILGGGS